MVKRLDIQPGLTVLEPATGSGIFVDALLKAQHGETLKIDAYELAPDAIQQLHQTYANQPQVQIFHSDTLTDTTLSQRIQDKAGYDRIIANPPYGGWLDYDQRKALKRQYPNLYVKETYSLFLYRCVQLLKDGGKLVFIIPDTWLNLHMHTYLRQWLLDHTTILELALFPSSFFPGVNFGYANLCILTLQKQPPAHDHTFNVLTGFRDVGQLARPDESDVVTHRIEQATMLANIDHALFISDNPAVMACINHTTQRIGDIAACVTGFYSGDDKTYLKTSLDRKRYGKIDETKIYQGDLVPALRDGVEGVTCYIPLVKGGAQPYIKLDEWFMLWSKTAVQHFQQDKKARFQNAAYYFREGVGVPMVSSSRITAALLEQRLFDQSIVGIFPHAEKWLYYLLAFFNSPTCNTLIRTINPSANNSARYIRKIPFISPDNSQLRRINQLVQAIIKQLKSQQAYDSGMADEAYHIIQGLYGF